MYPVEHFSVSSANCYLCCPAKWRYRYIEGLPEPSSPALERGKAVHQAIEAYWQNQYKPEPGVHRYVAAYRRTEWAVRPEQARHIELELTGRLEGVAVPLLGYADVLTTEGLIVDLKTSGRHWTAERALSELQPAVYTHLARCQGHAVEGFEFHVLVGDGRDRDICVARFPVRLTEEDQEEHLDALRIAWAGIVDGRFPASRSLLCAFCSFAEACRRDTGIEPLLGR